MDNGNRPGIYIETKEPWVNPGIEQALYTELDRLGWNIMTQPETSTEQFYTDGAGMKKVNVGNTNGKVIIQTFSLESLRILNSIFAGKIPTCFLLWLGNGPTDMPTDDPETYAEFINFGLENNAVFMGPSIAGAPNKYPELLKPGSQNLFTNQVLQFMLTLLTPESKWVSIMVSISTTIPVLLFLTDHWLMECLQTALK